MGALTQLYAGTAAKPIEVNGKVVLASPSVAIRSVDCLAIVFDSLGSNRHCQEGNTEFGECHEAVGLAGGSGQRFVKARISFAVPIISSCAIHSGF
jgi:hypothetical protein